MPRRRGKRRAHRKLAPRSSSELHISHGNEYLAEAMATSLKSVRNLREEVMALIRADLRRMPDVQALIHDHVHALPSLQQVLVQRLPIEYLIALVRQRWAQFPDVHAFVVRHLDHFPEWEKLAVHEGSDKPTPQSFASIKALSLPELKLPPDLAQRFREAILSTIAAGSLISTPSIAAEVQDAISENAAHIPELFNLIEVNLHRLPHLTKLLHAHYLNPTPALKAIEFLPKYLRDNEFILSGYRPELVCSWRVLKSLTYLHNESVNIYTHLVAALVFCFMAVDAALYVADANRPWLDLIAFQIFFVSALVCLVASATFHAFYCHSLDVGVWANKLDFLGITALIVGSVMSVVYFTFYCHTNFTAMYWGAMVVAGMISTYGTFYAQSAIVRSGMFIALAAVGFTPMLHYSTIYGFSTLVFTVDTTWIVFAQCFLYLTGVLFYCSRFPECMFPGKFDIWLHSHQIWHLFVVAAAACHYVGIYNMYQYRATEGCALEHSLNDSIQWS